MAFGTGGRAAGILSRLGSLAQAASVALGVTALLCGARLLPFGQAALLVHVPVGRLPQAGAEPALQAAALAGAAFVSTPAAGYAVVYGDANRVRRIFGLAVPWDGTGPCAVRS